VGLSGLFERVSSVAAGQPVRWVGTSVISISVALMALVAIRDQVRARQPSDLLEGVAELGKRDMAAAVFVPESIYELRALPLARAAYGRLLSRYQKVAGMDSGLQQFFAERNLPAEALSPVVASFTEDEQAKVGRLRAAYASGLPGYDVYFYELADDPRPVSVRSRNPIADFTIAEAVTRFRASEGAAILVREPITGLEPTWRSGSWLLYSR
jgi:hypothetical protein